MKLMTGRMFEEALRRFQCVFAKPFARTQLVELCAPLFRVEAGWLEAKRLSGSSRSTTQGAPRRKLLLRWHLLEEILQALRTLPIHDSTLRAVYSPVMKLAQTFSLHRLLI
jgi:hypothetical protein